MVKPAGVFAHVQCVSEVPTPWAAAALRIFIVYFRNQFVLLFPGTTGNTNQSIKISIYLSALRGTHLSSCGPNKWQQSLSQLRKLITILIISRKTWQIPGFQMLFHHWRLAKRILTPGNSLHKQKMWGQTFAPTDLPSNEGWDDFFFLMCSEFLQRCCCG